MQKRILPYLFVSLAVWDTPYLAFILGVLISDLTNSGWKIKSKLINIVILVISLFLGSYPTHLGTIEGSINVDSTIYSIFQHVTNSISFIHTVANALMLIVVLNSKAFIGFLSLKPLQYLGKVSFSLYLTHTAIIDFFQ